MTTLREAALMALGALEYIDSPLHVREIDKVGKAIAALDAALEQPEHTEQPLEMVATCKECLPVEREPVACVQDLDEVKRKHLVYEKGMDWKDALYTHPPKREWQGLTDEDHEAFCIRSNLHPVIAQAIAEYIEAKLKEKNA